MEVCNAYEMTRVAAAFTASLGVEPPRMAQPAAEPLARLLADAFDGRPAQKAVIYNPDAIAQWLYQKYTPEFTEVTRYTQLALPLRTMMPSVTPVCFATMYTGTAPQIHGIQRYEKPVVRVDSVFDALIRAGKKCAIVSQTGASMSRIFLEREMDYFTDCESDEDAVRLGIQLIESDRYDFIVIYNGWYDHMMHSTRVEDPEALQVFRDNCRFFGEIARAVQRAYAAYDTFLGFATDHGCHDHPDTGRGTHGTDLPDDLNVIHFYGTMKGTRHGD